MKTKMVKVGFYRFGGFKFFIYNFPNQKENHTKGLFKEESMIKKATILTMGTTSLTVPIPPNFP